MPGPRYPRKRYEVTSAEALVERALDEEHERPSTWAGWFGLERGYTYRERGEYLEAAEFAQMLLTKPMCCWGECFYGNKGRGKYARKPFSG